MISLLKTKFYLLILTAVVIGGAVQCGKDKMKEDCCNCTAPETQTGEGTISFELNGKVWNPCYVNNEKKIMNIANLQYNFGEWHLGITGRQYYGNEDDAIVMDFWTPIKGKLKYAQVGDTRNRFALSFFYYTGLHPEFKNFIFDVDTLKPYSMEITRFDTVNKVVSGRFSCEMKSDDNKESIKITNGRFDVPILIQ